MADEHYTPAVRPFFNNVFVIQVAVQEAFQVGKRQKRVKKGHDGVKKSSKKKSRKGRAAYSLRGVNGEMATPL